MNVSEWISRNCRFAQQQQQQQQLLPFDPEEDWQEDPAASHAYPELEATVPPDVEKDEFLDGFYHVTTNLPAVLHWGALKSRRQLGDVPGLGGGFADDAPNKVSLTYNQNKAWGIYEGLLFASNVARDKAKASEVLDYLLREYNSDEIPKEVLSVLFKWGVPKSILEEEFHEGLENALDSAVVGGESKYDFMTEVEAALKVASRDYDDPSVSQGIVGFTADYATFSQINPSSIAILRMQVRKGAPFEHVYDELELRFDPDDVRLAPNPVVKSY